MNKGETQPHRCSGVCLYAMLMVSLAAFVFVTTFLIVLRCCCCRPERLDRSGDDDDDNNNRSAAIATAGGLDPGTIESIPAFVYAPSFPGEKLECPVCLGELSEGEKARLLPGCRHRFHVECVDEWLRLHATCPLCRRCVVIGIV